jgi:hypothetical protein
MVHPTHLLRPDGSTTHCGLAYRSHRPCFPTPFGCPTRRSQIAIEPVAPPDVSLPAIAARPLVNTASRTVRLGQCPFRVCAVQRRRFPVGANPTRQPLQPEAIGAVMEVTKWLKPSISVSQIGDSASVQAATRMNAEQSSKRTMRRSTRQPYRGRLIRLDEMSETIRSDAAPG